MDAIDIEVVCAKDLDADMLNLWRRFCLLTPAYSTPFLSPSFALAVSTVRDDVWIAVLRRDGAPVGFWPFHRRPAGHLRPLAAPVSDWHGPVLAPGVDLDPVRLVTACGGSVARFTSLSDPSGVFAAHTTHTQPSWRIDLSDGAEAYRAALKERSGKHLANTSRCARKAAREVGPLRFEFHEPSVDAFEKMTDWKRQQFGATGKFDIFDAPWIQRLFSTLWRWRDSEFGLVFSTLYFGDRLAAGELYLRKCGRMHAWISSFDRELTPYAPGHILTDQMIDVCATYGVTRLDFGAGSDDYKAKWCLGADPISQAIVHAATPVGRVRSAMYRSWRSAYPALGDVGQLMTKVRGRTDHVFAAQPSWIAASVALTASAFSTKV